MDELNSTAEVEELEVEEVEEPEMELAETDNGTIEESEESNNAVAVVTGAGLALVGVAAVAAAKKFVAPKIDTLLRKIATNYLANHPEHPEEEKSEEEEPTDK